MCKHFRTQVNGDDIFRVQKTSTFNGSLFFLPFNLSITNAESNKFDRIVGFVNPVLFGLLLEKVKINVDDTLPFVPRPFTSA